MGRNPASHRALCSARGEGAHGHPFDFAQDGRPECPSRDGQPVPSRAEGRLWHEWVPWRDRLPILAIVALCTFAGPAGLLRAATTQTPWQTNAYGTLSTNYMWNYAMGYHFTPLIDGQVTALGGYFNGTKTVKLFNKATGLLLASATVSAANAWAYTPIAPVNVSSGTTYTVAVYLAGSGGSARSSLNPALPQTFKDIRIESSTYVSTSTVPTAVPTNIIPLTMYGQADIQFVSATTDTTPPTGSVTINSGVTYTNTTAVTLNLSATDDSGTVAQMQFSNDNATYSTPEAYATTKTWTLTSGDGTKTVYVKFKDPAGNWSTPVTDTIVLDTTAPTGTITINAGAASTSTTAVTLSLSATDASGTVSQMQFSNDNITYSAPEAYTTTKSWTLTTGDGTKTVYVKFQDAAGNWSSPTSDTIVLATTSSLQTPWQTNAYGTLSTNIAYNYAMGYHFTPLVNGQVTGVGGYFNGTKTVKLFNKTTGTLLASATVTAANTWAYTPITPVNVTAGTTYTIAVYLAGSGGSSRSSLSPVLPRTFGDIRIEGSTYALTSTTPTAVPTNTITTTMYGQADIQFVSGTTPPDTTPPTINSVSPQPSPALYAGDTLTLSASVTDTDPSPLEYQFSVDSTVKQAWSATTTYPWITTSAQTGSHTITVEVRDAGGAQSKSQTLYLYLKPPGPP